MRASLVRLAIVCAAALMGAGMAHAHAALHHATPAADSTISEPPRDVTLQFTDTLEAAFSSVDVTDVSGARVDQGRTEVAGNTMRIDLKPLSPGSYRVHWRVVSVDTHKSEGSFTFKVSGR
jgi:methionine-rich copper-binding protein CopC